MRAALLLALAFTLTPPALAQQSPVVPIFVEETAAAGIDSAYAGDFQYMVGGGVATFDCNADGFPDMLLAGGEDKASFYVNRSARGGELSFSREASGLEIDGVTGAYPIDVDSDGVADVLLLRIGASMLMRGLGACQFATAPAEWQFDGGDAWWTAFAATWEKGASWPTFALGSYIDRREEIDPWGSCTPNWLERPVAAGNGFAAPVPLLPSYCALSMLFTDWDRSGIAGLRIANDREYYTGGQEQMWRVPPGGDPVLYTAKDGWKTLKIWGMGIASGDVTGDGYPDYFVTSMADNKLQTLASPAAGAAPDYKDVAFPRGAIAQRPYTGGDVRPSTAWHAQFEDVNNDGWLDLFIAKGNVDAMPDFAANDPNNLLLQQPDGKFVEAGDRAGIASMAISRGAAMPDFNLDGLLDLVVVNRRQTAQVWRNTSPDAGHWLGLRLTQPGINRDATGAVIEVRAGERLSTREVTIGGGHVSGQLGFWHFGLGAATDAEVRVTWPHGEATGWLKVSANGFYTVTPGAAPELWTPPR